MKNHKGKTLGVGAAGEVMRHLQIVAGNVPAGIQDPRIPKTRAEERSLQTQGALPVMRDMVDMVKTRTVNLWI